MKLNENFMAELFKLIYSDIEITRVCYGHITYQLIPQEWAGYKILLKEAIEQYENREKVSSLGVVGQKYSDNSKVQEAIKEIKKANLVDKELLIDQLESYIKDVEFQILNDKVFDLYKEGKKEEAIKLNVEECTRILNTSLRKTSGKFARVFEDFFTRQQSKRDQNVDKKNSRKVPFGIAALDTLSYGGADESDLVLWIMRSGVGKSTVLRHHGINNAMEEIPTLHIQLEEGVDACLDRYDQAWTGMKLQEIKKGFIDEKKLKKIEITRINMMERLKSDIDVYGFTKFGEASCVDVRNIILEYFKIYGFYPKSLIVDSLDLLKTGINDRLDNDPKYLKYKLQKNSQLLKDMATEFNMVIFTATQTSDVPFEIWNNEDKVIDRSFTEGDKTLVKPYSFVFTGNITIQEKKEEKCRIFIDKLRDYSVHNSIVPIITDYAGGKFYSKTGTNNVYNNGTVELKKETPDIKKGSKGSMRKI